MTYQDGSMANWFIMLWMNMTGDETMCLHEWSEDDVAFTLEVKRRDVAHSLLSMRNPHAELVEDNWSEV